MADTTPTDPEDARQAPPARPPGTLGVLAVLTRAALRRWLNRLSHQIGRLSRARGATPRKSRRGTVLVLFMTAVFLHNGVSLMRTLAARLATEVGAATSEGDLVLPEALVHDLDSATDKWLHLEALMRWRAARRRAAEPSVDDHAVAQEVLSRLAARLRELRYASDPEVARRMRPTITYVLDNHDFDRFDYDASGAGDRARAVLSLLALLTLLAATFSMLGSAEQELGRVDWSLEWLFGFPVPARALFLARVVERALTNGFAWMLHVPLCGSIAFVGGAGWSSPLLAVVGATALNLVSASLAVLAEVALRRTLAPDRLRNAQAVLTVLAVLSFGAAFTLLFDQRALSWAVDHTPRALAVLPIGQLSHHPLAATAATVGIAGAFAALAVLVCQRLVAGGVLVTASSQRGKRVASSRRLHGIVGRELRLLARDRALLVQTLIAPLLLVGFQLVINPSWLGGIL